MALRNRTEYSPTIQWSSPLLYDDKKKWSYQVQQTNKK